MSTLEVLQHCPIKGQTLLSTIGALDPSTFCLIKNTKNPNSPTIGISKFTLLFCGKHIHETIIDEGDLTCVMSLSCLRSIGYSDLN